MLQSAPVLADAAASHQRHPTVVTSLCVRHRGTTPFCDSSLHFCPSDLLVLLINQAERLQHAMPGYWGMAQLDRLHMGLKSHSAGAVYQGATAAVLLV